MKLRWFATLLLALSSEAALCDEYTASRYIFQLNLDAASNTHYFLAASSSSASSSIGWGSPSCPNAQYAYTHDLPGYKEVLAVVLSASAMGRPVTFFGSCDSSGHYFIVTKILMGQ
jgi:hypothetical protein